MEKPFSAYRGDGPYVFVCYAHEDSKAIYHEIAWLNDYGVNVWYDEGISPGNEWTDELASAIQGCTKVLYFVTRHSVASEHCRRELNFAQEEGREVVAIQLEPTEVPAGLRLSLNNRQAIFKQNLSDEEYHKQVLRVTHLGEGPISQPASRPSVRVSKLGLGVASAAVAVAIVATGFWRLNSKDDSYATADTTVIAASEETADREVLSNSIAVLPFENLSPDPNNAYFSAGIHEEILNHLAKIDELSVISRTSVLGYAGGAKSIPEIAHELKVSTVMEGSVRYAGDQVRITTQLIDAKSGAHLWTETYDRRLEDIFAIQSDIALNVTDAMKVQFSLAEQAVVAKRPTKDLDAYEHYVKALTLRQNLDSPDPVHASLDRAIALDPNFATAYATKAWLYGFQAEAPFQGNVVSRDRQHEFVRLAKEYADKALAIDPEQAEAHLALSIVAQHDRRWEESLSAVRRAYELDPNHYAITFFYGRALMRRGRLGEGIALIERAIKLDPRNWSIHHFFGMELNWQQQWSKAKDHLRVAVAMVPEFAAARWELAKALAYSGELGEAVDVARGSEELVRGWHGTAALAGIYALAGRTEDVARVTAWLEEDTNIDPTEGIVYALLVEAYTALGHMDLALQHLQTVVDINFPVWIVYNLHDNPDHPSFGPLRAHPRFDDIRAQTAKPL